jgi:hypothetical protein
MMNFISAQLVKSSPLPHVTADKGTLSSGLKIFYTIIGSVAVLLLVIAALRYVIAAGDANKISESKRMIAYTLVGLAVTALAATIVEFVLKVQA